MRMEENAAHNAAAAALGIAASAESTPLSSILRLNDDVLHFICLTIHDLVRHVNEAALSTDDVREMFFF